MNVTTAELALPPTVPVHEPPEPAAEPVVAPGPRWQPAPAPLATTATELEPDEERSAPLAALLSDTSPRGAALRAGAGLLATLPFATVTSLAFDADPLARIAAVLALPAALAAIALVGLSASTIGVSLLSSPLSPAQAADAGGRGLLRAGQILLGLTPVCLLWVLSYGDGEAIVVPALAWALGGGLGTAAINGALSEAIHPGGRDFSLGTLVVLALFTLFTVVLGVRTLVGYVELLDRPTFTEVADGGAEGGAR